MKKSINKFILSISLIFLFTGCDDYVDYEASENYQIVADDYFKNREFRSEVYAMAFSEGMEMFQKNHTRRE